MTADEIVRRFDMEPVPEEGGLFARIWEDDHSTAIWFLLRPGDFSAMHRLTAAELWHHYAGAPAAMVLLGHPTTRPILGDDLSAGQLPCVPVPRGTWMGARTLGDWTLLGATMAPGFRPEMFELGSRDHLLERHPDAADDIVELTREA